MNQLHNVKIYGDTMVEMLMDRLISMWNPGSVEEEIYRQYYTDMVENGVYDDREFNVMEIVDNDWVNYTDIYTPSEAVENFSNLIGDLSDEGMSEEDFAYAVAEALENEGIGANVYEIIDGEYYIMTIQG